jgi:hypothetical protein
VVQEGKLVVDAGAQRERVDAVTDEVAVVDLGLTCERDSDHDVRLPGEPGDESLEGRKERDVQGAAVARSELSQLALDFDGEGRRSPGLRGRT